MDVTASATPVPMQFRHCMTNVVVKLEKGESFEGDIPADAQVYLYSTVTKASIDLSGRTLHGKEPLHKGLYIRNGQKIVVR